MHTITLPPKPARKPRQWRELYAEIETCDEITAGIRFYAQRDASTGHFELMACELEDLTVRMGGALIVVPVDLCKITSEADKAAILRQAEADWHRVESYFIAEWEREQEWNDPD